MMDDNDLLGRLEAHACMHDDLVTHDAEQAQWAADLRAAKAEIERLRAAILDWWASRRPVGWDAKQHAAHPLVNLGPSDEQLALIAAEIDGLASSQPLATDRAPPS